MGRLGGIISLTGLYPQMWEGATVPIPAEALRGTASDSDPRTWSTPWSGPATAGWCWEYGAYRNPQLHPGPARFGGLVLFSHRGGRRGVGVPRGWVPGAGRAECSSLLLSQEPWTEASGFSLSDGGVNSPEGHFFRVMAQEAAAPLLEGSRTLTCLPRWVSHAQGLLPSPVAAGLAPGSWSESDSPPWPLAGSVLAASSQSLRASSSAGTDSPPPALPGVAGPAGRLFHNPAGQHWGGPENFTQAEVRATFFQPLKP